MDDRHPRLIELCQKMVLCPGCPWETVKSQTVPPAGPCNAEVAVVGRNPGRMEDEDGLPFVDRAPGGHALNQFLAAAGLPREWVYVTNTAKCQGGKGDPPPPQEVYDNCKHWVEEEIAILQPKLMIVLGNDALREILNIDGSSARMQGDTVPYYKNPSILAFISSHPGWWVRKPGYVEDEVVKVLAPKLRKVLEKLNVKVLEVSHVESPTSESSPTPA